MLIGSNFLTANFHFATTNFSNAKLFGSELKRFFFLQIFLVPAEIKEIAEIFRSPIGWFLQMQSI